MVSNAKPRLVFVPGLGANGAVYGPFLAALRSSFDVRVADHPLRFPKHGLSWAFFFAAVDRAFGGKPGFLLGHSMGGGIALKYAASHPARVRKVVVVAPVVFPVRNDRTGWGLSRFKSYRYLRGFGIGLTGGHPLHAFTVFSVRRRIIADGRRQRLYEWARAVDLSPDLPKLREVAVLWPEREELIDLRTLSRLREEFPKVPTRLVPGAHNNLALAPRKLIPIVKEEFSG